MGRDMISKLTFTSISGTLRTFLFTSLFLQDTDRDREYVDKNTDLDSPSNIPRP